MHKNKHLNNSGVTLVELSIVIVIIGLLVAGTLVGESLIQQAKFTKAISQLKNIDAAWKTFNTKYNAEPGDFKKATTFFPDCVATPDYTVVCNGNGNGIVENGNPEEGIAVWRHLSLAGFLAENHNIGNYPGSPMSGAEYMSLLYPKIDINYPYALNILNLGYCDRCFAATNFRNLNGRAIHFSHLVYTSSVSSNNVQEMDMKLDDGKPTSGNLRTDSDEGDDCTNVGDNEYIRDIQGRCQFNMKY